MTTTTEARLQLIESQAKSYEKLLPEHVKVEKFIEVAKSFFLDAERKDNFLKAEWNSVLAAIAKCAKDGLLLDNKEAAITFRNKNIGKKDAPQWIKNAIYSPMVTGILKLARNSGDIKTISARLVYEKEEFKFWIEDGVQRMIHNPILFGDKGKQVCVYACAVLKDGSLVLDALDMAQIAKLRGMAETDYIWKNHPDEMAKKSALRKLGKLLDLSSDVNLKDAIEAVDELVDLEEKPTPQPIEEVKKPAPAPIAEPAKPVQQPVQPTQLAPANKVLTLHEVGELRAAKGVDELRSWYNSLSKEQRTNTITPEVIKNLLETAKKIEVKTAPAPTVAQKVEEQYEEVPFDADEPPVNDVF